MTSIDFESKFAREFAAFDQILGIADRLLEGNAERFVVDPKRRRLQAARAPFWPGAQECECLENFYKVLYRHGSSFEHSDTWGVQAFLEKSPEGPVLKSEPNENLVPQSLFAAYTFAQISVIVGNLFGFAFQGA